MPVFETGAFSHSATCPTRTKGNRTKRAESTICEACARHCDIGPKANERWPAPFAVSPGPRVQATLRLELPWIRLARKSARLAVDDDRAYQNQLSPGSRMQK